MDGDPQGFWSYVRKDDEAMHGAIKRLAEHVKAEYGVLTGLSLELFFDSASLKWGDDWKSRIRESLEATTFFIPIITPRYFASRECRNELLSFAEQAEQLDRRGLILPIYFVDVPAIRDGSPDDPAIRLIADRHREDWRTLRLLDETVQPYRVGVNRLTTHLLDVTRERQAEPAAQPQTSDDDDDEVDPSGGEGTTSHGPPVLEQSSLDTEPGIMELLAEGEDALPRIVETLTAIGPQIELVGELATAGTQEIDASDSEGKGFRGRLAVMNRLAQKLEEPANELEMLTSRYAADLLILDPAMKQLIRLVSDQAEDDPKAASDFFEMVRGMAQKSGEGAEGIKGFIASMEVDQFSRELKVPLQRMRVSLQSLVDGHELIESWKAQIEGLEGGVKD